MRIAFRIIAVPVSGRSGGRASAQRTGHLQDALAGLFDQERTAGLESAAGRTDR